MNPKLIKSGAEATSKLSEGAQALTDAVVSTLGPLSRNVAIDKEYPAPEVIHDGVGVARAIFFKDRFKNMGSMLLKEAAAKTNDGAGDGTTTSILLANTLYQEGLKLIQGKEGFLSSGVNSMKLRAAILRYSEIIIEKLSERAKKVITKEEARQIAIVSAQDPIIGQMVAEAIDKVGNEGVVMIEDAEGFETSLEIQAGTTFDNGFLSPYFMTDPGRGVAEYSDAYILLTDMRVSDPHDISPIVTQIFEGDVKDRKPLLVIADDVVGPALQAMVTTHLQLKYNMVAVVAPDYGERRREVLEDLAILTGAEVISHDLGTQLKDVKINQLGRVRNLRVSFTHTYLTPSNPDPEDILDRVKTIKAQIKDEQNNFKRERLEERLARLSQDVAIIKVGGGSKTEIKEKRERFIDAVGATKSALSEGTIPGGGVTLLQIAQELEEDKDVPVARGLVQSALESPFRTILENSGEVVEPILAELGEDQVFNVVTRDFEDPYTSGILDPVKVTRLAVKHAFSVASVMLTTNTLVADDKDEVPEVRIKQ